MNTVDRPEVVQLRALQRQFAYQLWYPMAPAEGVATAAFGPAIGVYQNNTRLTLLGVVQTTYPVIAKVLGDEFFTALARSYVITTPSTSGNLHGYAKAFSAWLVDWLAALEDREEATELGYLPDLAKLEWLVHQAHFASDAPPFDFPGLQAVDPARQGELRFILHPSCAVLRSEFPIAQIWRANQSVDVETANDESDLQSINWDAVPERLLLWRQFTAQFEITVKLLECDVATHQFLRDLADGKAFEEAASNALMLDAGLDLQALLLDKVSAGVIIGFRLPTEDVLNLR
jgi:Putative DNA-binding domain